MCISAKECQQTLSQLEASLKPSPIPCAPLTPRHHTRPDTDPWVEIHEELASEQNVLDDFLFYYFEIGNSFHVTLPKIFQHPTSSVSFPNVPNTKSLWFICAMIRDHRWHRFSPRQPDSCHRDHRRAPTAHGKESPAGPLRVIPPGFEYGPLDAASKSPLPPPTDSSQRIPNDHETWQYLRSDQSEGRKGHKCTVGFFKTTNNSSDIMRFLRLQLVPDVASSLATAQWKAHASHLRLFFPLQNGRRKWRHNSSWVG